MESETNSSLHNKDYLKETPQYSVTVKVRDYFRHYSVDCISHGTETTQRKVLNHMENHGASDKSMV